MILDKTGRLEKVGLEGDDLKKYIDKMLKEIEKNSDIFVDEELLEYIIEETEFEKEEKEESTYDVNQKVRKKQEEVIKKK